MYAGELKKALIRYTRLDPEELYQEAVNMLRKELETTQEHMDEAKRELQGGPPIQDTDITRLQQFINKLWSTVIDLGTVGRRTDLDNFGMVACLAGRLTGMLRERYENQLLKFKVKNDSRPGIKWFRDLLANYARRLRQVNIHLSQKGECSEKQEPRGTTNKAEGSSRSTSLKRKSMRFASAKRKAVTWQARCEQ